MKMKLVMVSSLLAAISTGSVSKTAFAESVTGLHESTEVRAVAAKVNWLKQNVSLTFAAGESGTFSRLYRVYGGTDGGENRRNWEFCDDLGGVRCDTTEMTCPLPDGWGESVRYLKFFLGGEGGDVNECVRVDYVDSTVDCADGAVAFNTECKHKKETRIECVAAVSDKAASADWVMLFGVCASSSGTHDSTSFSFFVRDSKNWVPRFNHKDKVVGSGFVYGEKVKVVAQGHDLRWYRDGAAEPAGSITGSGEYDDGVNSMFILGMNDSASVSSVHLRAGTAYAKLYSFSMYDNNALSHEFVPVRVKDGNGAWTGALMDTQNGNKIHRNVGKAAQVAFGPVTDAGDPKTGSDTLMVLVPSMDDRAVAIVGEVTGGKVGLRFGEGEKGSYAKLYMAYGAVDGGADRTAWEQCTLVDAIAADELVGECELPDGWGSSVFAVRFFLGDGVGMRRVEYIDSAENFGSKSHYFDVGYIHKAETRVECVANVSNEGYENNYAALFGVSGDNGSFAESSFAFFVCDSSKWVPRYNRSEKIVGSGFVYNEKVKIVAQGNDVAWYREGEEQAIGSLTGGGSYDVGMNTMFIFDMNAASTYPARTPRDLPTKAKLYSFRMFEGDNLAREFLPVRIPGKAADSYTGALLETQTGNIVSNLGNAVSVAYGPIVDDGSAACGSRTLSLNYVENDWPRKVDFIGGDKKFARISISKGIPGTYTRLVMVYGAEDGGDDRENWTHRTEIGAVGCDVTEMNCAWPEGWGKGIQFVRFFLGGAGGVVPVEYLDTTIDYASGAYAFDTEYLHKAETRVECEAIVVNQDQYAGAGGWMMLFGVCGESGSLNQNSYSFFVLDNKSWVPRYNRSEKIVGSGFVYNEKVKIVAQGNDVAWYREGEEHPAGTLSGGGTYGDGIDTMFILDMHERDASKPLRVRGGTASAKLYSFRLMDGGEVSREFVPVRARGDADASWTGALFETKTGKVHRNIGTKKTVPYGKDVSYSMTIKWKPAGMLIILK